MVSYAEYHMLYCAIRQVAKPLPYEERALYTEWCCNVNGCSHSTSAHTQPCKDTLCACYAKHKSGLLAVGPLTEMQHDQQPCCEETMRGSKREMHERATSWGERVTPPHMFYLMMGATPLPAQIIPLPSSSRLGVCGERRPPTMLESAIMVSVLVSACARLLLVSRSSARLFWSKKMSLGLSWLSSLLAKVETLRANPVAGSYVAVVLPAQLLGSVQVAALLPRSDAEAEPAGCSRPSAPDNLGLLQHQIILTR